MSAAFYKKFYSVDGDWYCGRNGGEDTRFKRRTKMEEEKNGEKEGGWGLLGNYYRYDKTTQLPLYVL